MKIKTILVLGIAAFTLSNAALAHEQGCRFSQFFSFALPLGSSLGTRAGDWQVDIVPTAYDDVVLFRAVNKKTGADCQFLKDLATSYSIDVQKGVLLVTNYSGSANYVEIFNANTCSTMGTLVGEGKVSLVRANHLVFGGGTDGGEAIAASNVIFGGDCKVKAHY